MENAQCGYYGLRGSHSLFRSLCELYPSTSEWVEKMQPLSRTDYIQLILVPEACLCLIAQDQMLHLEDALDEHEARRILEDSCDFGKIVHDEVEHDKMDGGHVF
jgi:thiamine monophosphate synthase